MTFWQADTPSSPTVDGINRRRAAAPDSDVVARYKADQQKVIAAASA